MPSTQITFSLASCRGLIEACDANQIATWTRQFSLASCRGLIEAGRGGRRV